MAPASRVRRPVDSGWKGRRGELKVHRDDVAALLFQMGRDDDAERALSELPELVDTKKNADRLSDYGIKPHTFEDRAGDFIARNGPIG
jgi:hypothetical protein